MKEITLPGYRTVIPSYAYVKESGKHNSLFGIPMGNEELVLSARMQVATQEQIYKDIKECAERLCSDNARKDSGVDRELAKLPKEIIDKIASDEDEEKHIKMHISGGNRLDGLEFVIAYQGDLPSMAIIAANEIYKDKPETKPFEMALRKASPNDWNLRLHTKQEEGLPKLSVMETLIANEVTNSLPLCVIGNEPEYSKIGERARVILKALPDYNHVRLLNDESLEYQTSRVMATVYELVKCYERAQRAEKLGKSISGAIIGMVTGGKVNLGCGEDNSRN